jgi:hypothetical protein
VLGLKHNLEWVRLVAECVLYANVVLTACIEVRNGESLILLLAEL